MRRLKKFILSPIRVAVKRFYHCNLSIITILISFSFCILIAVDVIQNSFKIVGHVNNDNDHVIRFKDGDWRKDYVRWANCSLRRQGQHDSPTHQDTPPYMSLPVRSEQQICIHPHLDPCSPGISAFDRRVDPVKCSSDDNWVFVNNGTFQISSRARAKYGKITCEYAPIVRGKNDFSARHAEHIKPMPSGSPLVSDFFKVACISPSGKRYHNIHAGIAYKPSIHARSDSIPLPKDAMGYSVFMFGFDSVSRMAWLRNLPKTRDFFIRHLGGVELTGYNIVGDGTVQALLPILTGYSEHDLPTSRRGDPGAVTVDDYPWIWNDFKKHGYVTAWAEDMSYIGTFQYRLKGFSRQPTDHSMRTYLMLAEPMYSHHKPYCLGSVPRHNVFLGWFRDVYKMYGDKPKFMFGFHSEYSHNNNNQLKKIDEDFSQFLKELQSKGYLDKTILVLMSDHGARFENIRATAQGKLEERMPYFAFRFPPDFQKRYPTEFQTFKSNAHRLTTPYDIHETFHDVINVSRSRRVQVQKRGVSLFQDVPLKRTCSDAGIEPHWCACLEWTKIDKDQYQNVSESVLEFINNLTFPQRHLCVRLAIKRVVSLFKFSPNSQLLKFEKSQDLHGDVPKFNTSIRLKEEYFQVTMETTPGGGMFEATVRQDLENPSLDVNARGISRINRYGNSPHCIASDLPSLRPYCYCVE